MAAALPLAIIKQLIFLCCLPVFSLDRRGLSAHMLEGEEEVGNLKLLIKYVQVQERVLTILTIIYEVSCVF